MADLGHNWTAKEMNRRTRIMLGRVSKRAQLQARRLAPRGRGDLMRSIRGRVDGHEAAHLASTSPYAAIAEYGGTIRPKKGRYLAIPLRGQRHGPRSEPGLFVRMAKSGHPLLARRIGRSIEPRFALRRFVERKPGRFMRPAFEAMRKAAREQAADEMRQMVKAGVPR